MTDHEIQHSMEQDTDQGSRALFDTYYNYVYAIVYRRVREFGSPEDVEECVIDVFTEVVRNYKSIQNGSLKSYIGTTAHNKAINTCRMLSARARRTVSLDDENIGEPASPQDVAADAEQNELTRKLLQCIRSLGQPECDIMIQKYYLGLNAVQIGRTLHMHPVTIRRHIKHALSRLKTMLNEMDIHY